MAQPKISTWSSTLRYNVTFARRLSEHPTSVITENYHFRDSPTPSVWLLWHDPDSTNLSEHTINQARYLPALQASVPTNRDGQGLTPTKDLVPKI